MPHKKIFIIEDDIVILSGLEAKFNAGGMLAIGHNGAGEIKDILYKIKIAKPEFIILDLVLPVIDGFELLRDIKSDNSISSILIFVFSDFSGKDVEARCRNLGAEYYFIKTEFSLDDFVAKVKKIIKNKDYMARNLQ